MLTTCSNVFRCTRAQAREVAEDWMGLRQVISSDGDEAWDGMCDHKRYDSWEDWQTGGGGCRITWMGGVAWVSRHSGYPQADVTDEACELFRYLGCRPVKSPWYSGPNNPRVYGDERAREDLAKCQ